jgi:spore coat protein A
MITRRQFVRGSALWSSGLLAGLSESPRMLQLRSHDVPIPVALDPNTLAKFVDPLPIPSIARANGFRPSPTDPKVKLPYFKISMQASNAKLHRDLKPTSVWTCDSSLPGPTFETRSGEGLLVDWTNDLPPKHFLPIDHKIHGAEASQPEVRSVIHLHGARARPESDGYPEKWIQPGESALYHYPNEQDACALWYHDHALGINRLNVYAGLFGMFLIRDAHEETLNLPQGEYEIPLIIFDRVLSRDGALIYPVSGDPASPWVPEVFGDAMLVNGKLFPYLDVQPRKYRFRILNASNGRFYHLALSNSAQLHQIGTDQGLLPKPVFLSSLVIAPGERADVILDFSDQAGDSAVLMNDAFNLLQFRVSKAKVPDTSSLPATLREIQRIAEADAIKTRILTLDEYENQVAEPVLMLLNGTHWNMPVTEKPQLNSTEIWSFINPTDDSHPIHLHLVRFQILDRRQYDPWAYQTSGKLIFTGPPAPPDLSEAGWKDTVRADPRMVTRIIVPFKGYPGKYVWHCHILEHEDNEMMRPFEIVP